jgi:AcrR family transcriptional regulator
LSVSRLDVTARRVPGDGLAHEAFIYSSDEEFLATLVPFLRAGLRLAQPTLAVVTEPTMKLLRDALDEDAEQVSFVDATTFYRSPANAIAEYRRRLATELARGGTDGMRVIGEIQFGTSHRDHDEWMRYESAVNAVFAPSPTWLICGYDTRALPDQTIVDAERAHPFVRTGTREGPSATYAAPSALPHEPVDPGPARAGFEELARLTARTEADRASVRRAVAETARSSGLAAGIVDDVTVAANELVLEALAADAPQVSVRIARTEAQWRCEIAAEATPHEPLFEEGSPGLWIAHLITEDIDVIAVGGAPGVNMTFDLTEPNARRRILAAASQLFYQHGIRATGIDKIISQSGVAKATFYRQFPSKDALLVAWLRQPETRWLDWIRVEVEARAESPANRLLTFFDVLLEWLEQDDFRGCAFLNAAAEIPQHDHPARQVIREHLQEIQDYLRRTVREANLPFPELYAKQLHVLVAGAIETAVATGSTDTARAARAAAEQLLTQRP